jgi:pimeloyl-ACP methyl ester carboxylesterase
MFWKLLEKSTGWLVSWFVVPPMLVEPGEEPVRQHVIVIDHAGMAVPIHSRPSVRVRDLISRARRPMTDVQYRDYLTAMMENLRECRDQGQCRGVVIIISGGNEMMHKMLKNSIDLYQRIKGDGYYPIFINWDSNLKRAYTEQLFRIRSGQYAPWWRVLVTLPFYFTGDLLKSIAHLIPSIVLQVYLLCRSLRWYRDPTTKRLNRFQPAPPNIEVTMGRWQPGFSPEEAIKLIPAFFFQALLVLPFVGLGVPRAWENLRRRTRAMFRAPREFDPKLAPDKQYEMPNGSEHTSREGAMAVFLEELAKTLSAYPRMKVRLIAHSMGSMVANEVLYYRDTLPYESIVYMAPACSVRDFARAVIPIVSDEARSADTHVLTLHPRVEAGQRDLEGWLGGSVLEWLEGILTPPHTYLDRMLGKWDNVLRTLHVFEPAARPRIHIKGFSYDGKNRKKPYKHVHFNDPDVPFWTEDFWKPDQLQHSPSQPTP